MMLILELCFRFFCCGLFAIGGGLATLPSFTIFPRRQDGIPLVIFPT
mgnify:CR=1 FL=1